MPRDKDLHLVAQKYLDNYLRIREGSLDTVYREQACEQIPHDTDEIAASFLDDLDVVKNVADTVTSPDVLLIRDCGKYLQGLKRDGKALWTEKETLAHRIPVNQLH